MEANNATSLFEMKKWWTSKVKWYHKGYGHFNTELYIRICEAKENRKRFS